MLVPDRMAKLWQSVEAGQMSTEDCVSEQEVLLEPYRAEWKKANCVTARPTFAQAS